MNKRQLEVCGVPLSLEDKAGMVFATSAHIRGLLLCQHSDAEIMAEAPVVIATLVAASGMERGMLERLEGRALLRMAKDIATILKAREAT